MKTEKELLDALINSKKKDDKKTETQQDKNANPYGINVGVYTPKKETKDNSNKNDK